jgi:hypothetical protein
MAVFAVWGRGRKEGQKLQRGSKVLFAELARAAALALVGPSVVGLDEGPLL